MIPGLLTSSSESRLDHLRSDFDSNDNTAGNEDGMVRLNDENDIIKGQESIIPRVVTSMSDSHLDELRFDADADETTTHSPGNDSTTGLKVLFLSSDTGGGHRASAESLANQFQILFPGTTYDLLDVVEKDGVPPYNSLVTAYKHLSNRPSQWKLVYSVSNSRAFEVLADAHLKLMCERAVRRRIKSYHPDVVVSVHPLMTNVPVLSCANISAETGKHLPIFTVVTDLGSAHCLWFANGVEKMFVGSEAVKELAKARGKVPEEKLVLAGLPIRNDFPVQAELLGDRYSEEGRAYQLLVRRNLNLPSMMDAKISVRLTEGNGNGIIGSLDRPTLLLMGGGEGVGSLENITDALYVELARREIDALILVVCGRNEKLKSWIEKRNWSEVYDRWLKARQKEEMKASGYRDNACGNVSSFPNISLKAGCIEIDGVTDRIRKILRYTTGKGNVKAVMSKAPSETSNKSDSGDEISTNCSGDELIATASEVLAHLQYGDQDDDTKIQDGERQEASLQVDQMVDDSDIGNIEKEELAGKVNSAERSFDVESFNSVADVGSPRADVTVFGLGFINEMAEYMVASDILISKAGPGTISEAAALSLPVMLTSFLPGQEEGNVDYVIDGGFGAYCSVADPIAIAEQVCAWLQDEEKLKLLGSNAKLKGTPYAARDIAKAIGESTLRWKEHNREVEEKRKLEPVVKSSSSFSLLRRRSEANVSSKQ